MEVYENRYLRLLGSDDHEERLNDLFLNVEDTFYIVSPFIGLPIVKRLCSILESNSNIRCEVITRFSREDFINGASNLLALEKLLQHNVHIYALRELHTKLYLIDKKFALLGSANYYEEPDALIGHVRFCEGGWVVRPASTRLGVHILVL